MIVILLNYFYVTIRSYHFVEAVCQHCRWIHRSKLTVTNQRQAEEITRCYFCKRERWVGQ